MTSSNQGSLHTLGDEGAANYIEETLSDQEPLLSNEIPPPLHPDPFHNVPRQADYENPPINPYYIQQSYDDRMKSTIYDEDTHCFSMSRVRRMFCLLSLFDCLMTFLMWVIYLQLSDGGITDNLAPEVKNLTIHTSLFDIVLCSIARSLVLLLFYSCLMKSTKWYAVALTTSASTIFLLMKVFLLKGEYYHKGNPINFFLIIFSFIITWCEAWHFDFKVIPQELQTKNLGDIRTSSLPPIAGGSFLASDQQRRQNNRGGRSRFGAPSSFYTPYAGSNYYGGGKSHISEESEDDSQCSDISAELGRLSDQEDHALIRKANDTLHMVFRMLYISDGWNMCREEKDNIIVQSRNFDGVGKVYKLEAVIDVNSSVLDQVFWVDVDSQPSWNASVKECRILRKINKLSDIIYSVAAEAGGGIISSRDFVSLRRRKRKGPLTLLCNVSIETPLMPPVSSIVRGKNGPGGWVLRDIPGEPNKTEFIWLLNTKLGGWLPQKLVETSLAGVMVDTVRDIRQHVSTTLLPT